MPRAGNSGHAVVIRISLPPGAIDRTWWHGAAQALSRWSDAANVDLRDAIWLVPYSALLPVARDALAALPGWQARVETVSTLLTQLGPAATGGGPGDDPVLDRLQASQWLKESLAGSSWSSDSPRTMAQAVDSVVRCAESLRRAAASLPPGRRDAWWPSARALLGAGAGPGQIERQLARVALEWAASASFADVDTLRGLRPSAWVALCLGGADPLVEALMNEAVEAGVPVLWLDADPADPDLFTAACAGTPPAEVICVDAEDEAQAACAVVLQELEASSTTQVALVAQDRETTRRVRALLERWGVRLVDDTGWKLATTRAAASLMALLRAAQGLQPGRADSAADDQRLDWLKDDPIGRSQPDALAALEAQWRGQRVSEAASEQAQALWERATAALAPLSERRRRPLADWLDVAGRAWLGDTGTGTRWRDDAAGRSVIAALRMDGRGGHGGTWAQLSRQVSMSLDEFVAWVDEVLCEAPFVPPHDVQARVVIAPMARVIGRPFDAVVFPGVDERRLGPAEPQPDLIGPQLARELGIEHPQARLLRATKVFAQIARQRCITLIRRAAEGSEPLSAGAWIEQWRLAWQRRAGVAQPFLRMAPSLKTRAASVMLTTAPAPSATGRWPDALSASAVEALRACPYRFFSRVLLRLGEVDELDRLPAKRDYGNWLHDVLWRFHEGRTPTTDHEADAARLRQCAQDGPQGANVAHEAAHADGELLPFLASFEALVEPYVTWLHARETAGWRWAFGELDRRIQPESLGGMALRGRLDRIDQHEGGRIQLLDYKTGSVAGLKAQLADRSEDTQLAFYAALVAGHGDASPDQIEAAYLAMDDRESPLELPHADVGRTAALLVDGLSGELRRLRTGEPMRPLGCGETCERCEARGLCRRDHWASEDEQAQAQVEGDAEGES